MTELLEATFLDEGSKPVFQPRTQTCMADLFITELEDRRAKGCLNRHKGAGPDGLFPPLAIALNAYIANGLGWMFNLTLQTVRIPEGWRRELITTVTKSPRPISPRQFRPTSLMSIAYKIFETILKNFSLTCPKFPA